MASNQRNGTLALIELNASIIALGAIGAVVLNYLAAHLTFFGEEVVIDSEQVRNYWICVAVLGVSVIVTFVASALRAGIKAFVWHSLVGLLGLVAAVAFAVTQTGAPAAPDPEPEPTYEPGLRGACHSGGDNDGCIGG